MKLFPIMDEYYTIVDGLPEEFINMLNAFCTSISIPLHSFNTLLACP
jgi:hypothetical protein